ncbi:MAG: radical SAM protein [Candidatus Obscuribacterales bacterium]|nr:radical SAM protein [Candidatus Obscuribacterales bacterium]
MGGIERLSIEVTNKCAKACSFCYNSSLPGGGTTWTRDNLVDFVSDCAGFGVKAVSFGGGEPFQYEGIFDVLDSLRGKVFRSMTTNGLLLEANWDSLLQVRPDKVHVSIHFPDNKGEVEKVVQQVTELASAGIKSGVNFLVRKSMLAQSVEAAHLVRNHGISNERIVYLPMRGFDTPTPRQVALVAGDTPFQSMSCLSKCAASPRFCSIGWDKKVGWCSYTTERAALAELSFAGLQTALTGLGLVFCGGTDEQVA